MSKQAVERQWDSADVSLVESDGSSISFFLLGCGEFFTNKKPLKHEPKQIVGPAIVVLSHSPGERDVLTDYSFDSAKALRWMERTKQRLS